MSKAAVTHTTLPAEFSEIAAICTATEIEIGGRTMFGIADARDLHTGLKVKRDYTTWIKARIARYGFREGADFEKSKDLSPPNRGSAKARAQIIDVYTLTLDMAKALAMVENNEQGRVVRRYFIWADEQFRQAPAPQRSPDELDRLYVAEAQARGFSVTFSPRAAIVHGPGGKSKRLPLGGDIYTLIAATIRVWEMQPPGFFELGSDLLRDMYLLVMNAMLRVEWGDEPNFGKALENVLADRINLRDGTAPSGKRLLDDGRRRMEWPDHFAGAGKPTAAKRRGELVRCM